MIVVPNVPPDPGESPPAAKPVPLPAAMPQRPSRGASWATALVVCCMIVGVLAAWIDREIPLRKAAEQNAYQFQTAAVNLESQREDLGRLLADPATKLIRLSGPGGAWPSQASLAWNPALQKGALFWDQLPVLDAGLRYDVLASSDGQATHRVGQVQARLGVSIYSFDTSEPISDVRRFQIQGPGPGGAVILSGDVK